MLSNNLLFFKYRFENFCDENKIMVDIFDDEDGIIIQSRLDNYSILLEFIVDFDSLNVEANVDKEVVIRITDSDVMI